jgi:UDP-2,4-diacetamido-2,4,6-trideoxy-beta-L-altropyranose hydrolase
MRIAFRVDASIEIGTGHVMRCLALAHALTKHGAVCKFICRAHEGNLIEYICAEGFQTRVLMLDKNIDSYSNDTAHSNWLGASWVEDVKACTPLLKAFRPDWLVVDHYGLDARWEMNLAPYYRKLMVVDDLADRPHDSDLLLDQNLGRQAQDYASLLRKHTQTLIGPTYALLRPEFAQCREISLHRRKNQQLKNILITMGGIDKDNITGRVLDSLRSCELPSDLRITVVMGANAPLLRQVQAQAKVMPWPSEVLVCVNNMAKLMVESDLCIGAAGSTSWERCCLGLPTIQLILAANQKEINEALELAEAVMTVKLEKLRTELPSLIAAVNYPAVLNKLSLNAAAITDGLGVVKTVQWLEKI